MPHENLDTDSEEIRKLKERLSSFETDKGRISGLSYKPLSKDEVIIATSPKSGTTWLQQICHQIRAASAGGDMSFSEISAVVPWLELAYDQGQNLYDAQYGDDERLPRLFKTHAWAPHCPQGCKVIVVFRDPEDVVLSFYRFFEDWFFPSGSISIEQFIREFWLSRGVPTSRMQNASYFVHLLSWYEHRNDSNVLILFFEDLKEHLEVNVRKICAFMSTSQHDFTTDIVVNRVLAMSSFDFMHMHRTQFDEKLSKLARNMSCGLPLDAGWSNSKLFKGLVGSGSSVIPTESRMEIQRMWKEIVEPVTGCGSYNEFREALSKTL